MDEQQQQQKPTIAQKLKVFYGECIRVLTVTKKPTGFEFKTIVKVSGIGIAAIGLVGFIITLIKQLVLG